MNEIIAWVTPEGDRSITAKQKIGMLNVSTGASASLAKSYSVPCFAGPETVTLEKIRLDEIKECMALGIDSIQSLMSAIRHKNTDDELLIAMLEDAFRQVRRGKEFFAAHMATLKINNIDWK